MIDSEYVNVYGTDITERKHMKDKIEVYTKDLEKQVEERTAELKESYRLAAIGSTAGMVGHDIRNPLQSIEGATYLGKEAVNNSSISSKEKASITEMFDAIEEQTKYINKIVLDLQDYSRSLKPEFIEILSSELIKDVLSNLNIPQNIEVSTSVEQNASKMKADPEMMRRLLVNLITNSIQAMPHGGELAINIYRMEDFTCINIRDTGAGIPEDVKPKLFQPTFTTKSKGQGFGPVVCKKIVEAHHGEISFESELKKGTVFKSCIPYLT